MQEVIKILFETSRFMSRQTHCSITYLRPVVAGNHGRGGSDVIYIYSHLNSNFEMEQR